MTEVLPDNFPVRKDSIEELVGHRNRCLEVSKQAHILLEEASEASERAAPFGVYAAIGTHREIHGRRTDGREEYLAMVRRHVDRYAWESLLNHSGLRNLMDATAHKEFRTQLDKDPPEFTVENITATFMTLAADAPAILNRSIVRVFEKLMTRRIHKTNSRFGIGPRIILTGAVSCYGWNSYGYTREMVNDMDRLFHVLDGKKPPDGTIVDVIGSKAREAKRGTPLLVTSEYFECKLWIVGGSLHMKFRRPDLVKQVNRILAKHFGEVLPDDREKT